MAFTPGWTKKLGRDAQLCRTVAEHREEGTARPVLRARCGPHDNSVLIITPKIRKTVTPLLQRSGLRAQRRRLVSHLRLAGEGPRVRQKSPAEAVWYTKERKEPKKDDPQRRWHPTLIYSPQPQ